ALVQFHELIECDRTFIKGGQAVLHADVVERTPRKPGRRIATEDVDLIVLHRAAGTLWVLDGIVHLRRGHHRIASAHRTLTARRREQVTPAGAVHGAVPEISGAGDRTLLLRGPCVAPRIERVR